MFSQNCVDFTSKKFSLAFSSCCFGSVWVVIEMKICCCKYLSLLKSYQCNGSAFYEYLGVKI